MKLMAVPGTQARQATPAGEADPTGHSTQMGNCVVRSVPFWWPGGHTLQKVMTATLCDGGRVNSDVLLPPVTNEQMTGDTIEVGGLSIDQYWGAVEFTGNTIGDPITVVAPVQETERMTSAKMGAKARVNAKAPLEAEVDRTDGRDGPGRKYERHIGAATIAVQSPL